MDLKIASAFKFISLYFVVTICSQDGFVLRQMKRGFHDPTGALHGWNDELGSPCNWTGITCDDNMNRVQEINLTSTQLSGPLPAVVGRLSALKKLSLAINNISGSIPTALAKCSQLEYLDLSQNSLVGRLPEFISELRRLIHLDLSENNLTGSIPAGFGKLSELQVLRLVGNSVSDIIPPSLGNLSNLVDLSLAYNRLSGTLPAELGNLTKLQNLWLAHCNLMGEIPDSIGHLVQLTNLDLSMNSLRGSIPDSMANLINVVQMELYQNNISGRIPISVGKMKALRRFDASMNNLDGSIPAGLGSLEFESLNLYENSLVGEIPPEIGLSRNLRELKLFSNRLTGSLPESLGRFSSLKTVDVADNRLTGRLPPDVCRNRVLNTLCLFNNDFIGTLPESLAVCYSLTSVWISNNRFTGEVPLKFWGLPQVFLLQLSNNSFQGIIPAAIGKAKSLLRVDISNNNFSGRLPLQIGQLRNLTMIVAGNNSLSGTLPSTLVNLSRLEKLDLHSNQLTGELLNDIGAWRLLTELNLSGNRFSGSIPTKLGDLPVLARLDLSDNLLTGLIPTELGNLHLIMFNVSDNRLYGAIPAVFENSIYEESFLRNPWLCSNKYSKEVTSCAERRRKREAHRRLSWVLLCLFALGGFILLVGLFWFYKHYCHSGRPDGNDSVDKSSWSISPFHILGFSASEILDCLDEDSIIGTGGAGKVYRAVLSNGEVVAVKRLWNSAGSTDNGFEAEVRTLGNVRHTNIVKLLCCCANRDSKLLVYEYMPNGSLGDMLRGPNANILDWPIRYKIAIGAAQGLAYLHHDCCPPIVHRDVKSNNILLDGDFNARIADFGLARILQGCEKGPESMTAIAGTYGYIAPEYAYTLKVNVKSDIYSFGVVLLELLTGRRPLDAEFGEGEDIVKWVRKKIEKQDGSQDVLDPNLSECSREEMDMVLTVALLCASALPAKRPPMRVVVEMLWAVRHTTNANTSPIPKIES